jgi:hypothetical protein
MLVGFHVIAVIVVGEAAAGVPVGLDVVPVVVGRPAMAMLVCLDVVPVVVGRPAMAMLMRLDVVGRIAFVVPPFPVPLLLRHRYSSFEIPQIRGVSCT